MKIFIFIVTLLSLNLAHAGTVKQNGVKWDYDDSLSFKNFQTRKFTEIPKGTTVYASFFDREEPGSEIFPANMEQVWFLKCHLRNVVIPSGNFLIDCTTTNYRIQNDLRDWELDDNGNPIRVFSEEYWTDLDFSTDPADIPAQRIKDPSQIPRRRR